MYGWDNSATSRSSIMLGKLVDARIEGESWEHWCLVIEFLRCKEVLGKQTCMTWKPFL